MRRLVTIIVLLSWSVAAHACLYDNDVGYDLTHGLPSVASILAGKWERHSDAYYESVIRVQSSRVPQSRTDGRTLDIPNSSVLSAAYIRRGTFEAVPLLLDESGKSFAESAATYSSRATAHLALGNFEAAKADLTKALALAPAGCFQRERYELRLVHYLQALKADPSLGTSQPTFVRTMLGDLSTSVQTATLLTDEQRFAVPRAEVQIDDAVTAVAAMIRFGNPQSAQLYAALGDLLRARGDYDLAYRAFRRALENRHPYPQVIQAQLDAIRKQVNDDSFIADRLIDSERLDADQWVAAFRVREAELMTLGQDADILQNYAEFYKVYGNPRFVEPKVSTILATQSARFWKPLVMLAGILIVFVLMLVRWMRDRRSVVASA